MEAKTQRTGWLAALHEHAKALHGHREAAGARTVMHAMLQWTHLPAVAVPNEHVREEPQLAQEAQHITCPATKLQTFKRDPLAFKKGHNLWSISLQPKCCSPYGTQNGYQSDGAFHKRLCVVYANSSNVPPADDSTVCGGRNFWLADSP